MTAPWVILATMCGVVYAPLLASVANVLACSSTVNDAVPSAVPTPPTPAASPDALPVLTPNALPIWMMFCPSVPAARWYRSVYAVLSDMAEAVTTLTGPRLPSPASLATGYHSEESAGWAWLEYVSGSETGGIHSGESPSSWLV